ncbi:MAG: LysR family transcriptional regulator, partial [Burkholderiales bacterium]|nr:LysR family transcriptional regulator [Burkholderiales bacterium]
HFNTRLFERGHGKISLTPAGEVVLEYAERILSLSAELETRLREMTGRLSGPLLIGASMTIAEFLLPRVLGQFKSQYPDVQAKLTVANSEAIESRVAEHTLDIGLIEATSHHNSLVTEVCCEDELQVVVAPGHPLAKEKALTPQQLKEHPFIIRETGSGTRQYTDLYFKNAGMSTSDLKIVMELGSSESVKGVVSTGLGYSILSRLTVAKELKLGELVAVPLQPRLQRSLSLIYPKERFRSRLINTFIEFAKTQLKDFKA